MRFARTGAVLGVVLALCAGATAANALWAARAALPAATVTTGDLRVSAQWQQPTPVWGQLFPGRSTADSTLLVTGAGAGQTLRWHLTLSRRVAPAFEPFITLQAWVGACGTGIPVPATGYSPAGGFAIDQIVSVCLRLTLSADAPSTLSGQPLNAVILVAANQRGS